MAQSHAVFDAESLIAAQAVIRRMPVGEAVVEAILDTYRELRTSAAERFIDTLRRVGHDPFKQAANGARRIDHRAARHAEEATA